MIGRIFAGVLAGIFILMNLRLTAGLLHEKCLLPLAEGNCSESIQRWFYNNRTGLCQAFVYRGCNGNANNFNSTAYCYHACNASADELHSYSISDATKKIKGNRGQQAAQAAAAGDRQSNGTDESTVTSPTNFEDERRRAASGQNREPSAAAAGNAGGSLSPTREPTLIQNRNQGSGSSPSRPRQPVNPASGDASAAAAAAGSSSDASSKPTRTKRSISSKSRHHRQRSSATEPEVEDAESEQTEPSDEENEDVTREKKQTTKRRLRHSKTKSQSTAAKDDEEETVEQKTDKKKRTKTQQGDDSKALNELLAHMESTASKLQKIADVAKSVKKTNGDRRLSEEVDEEGEEEGKELDAGVKKTEDDEEEGKHDDEKQNDSKGKKSSDSTPSRRRRILRRKTHARKPSTTKKQKSSKAIGKLVDVTVVGSNGIATASLTARKKSSLAELLRMGLDEGRKSLPNYEGGVGSKNDDDDGDDDEIEIVGERIRTIIIDPSYVFSYTNISNEDMVSLQEMVAQSDVGTLRLVEKDDKANELKDSVSKSDEKEEGAKPESPVLLAGKPKRTPGAASDADGQSTLLQREIPETSDADKKQTATGGQQQQPQQLVAGESEEKPAASNL